MSDYIKREDATEVYSKLYWMHEGLLNFQEELGKVYDEILGIPSADVVPVRHGHWIYDCCDIVCSECGTRYNDELCYMLRSDCSYHEPRYCLWCGARMDGEEDEID